MSHTRILSLFLAFIGITAVTLSLSTETQAQQGEKPKPAAVRDTPRADEREGQKVPEAVDKAIDESAKPESTKGKAATEPKAGTKVNAQSEVDLGDTESEMTLLENSFISLELKLNEEQQRELRELIRMARSDMHKVMARLPTTEAEREAVMNAVKSELNSIYQRYRAEAEDVLTPEQKQRLGELMLRVRGMSAITDPAYVEVLDLSEKQEKEIRAIVDAAKEQRKEIRKATKGEGKEGRQERREKLKQLRTETDEKIKAVLTPAQIEKFEKLKGSTFDFTKIQTQSESTGVDLGTSESLDAKPESAKPEVPKTPVPPESRPQE